MLRNVELLIIDKVLQDIKDMMTDREANKEQLYFKTDCDCGCEWSINTIGLQIVAEALHCDRPHNNRMYSPKHGQSFRFKVDASKSTEENLKLVKERVRDLAKNGRIHLIGDDPMYKAYANEEEIKSACRKVLGWRTPTKEYGSMYSRIIHAGSSSYNKVVKYLQENL